MDATGLAAGPAGTLAYGPGRPLRPATCALTKARPKAAIAVITALAGLSFRYGPCLLTLTPAPV